MRVVITGGGGFLGSRLARTLLEKKRLSNSDDNAYEISELVLVDVQAPSDPIPGAIFVSGDLLDEKLLNEVITPTTKSIFHLAAVVSAAAEDDYDLGMRVNFDLTRALIDRARALKIRPRFIFTSSLAVYGSKLPETVTEETATVPLSSYGTQKAMAELLINDATRRGFIDGRALRLPTVVVRPGKPNRAASAFMSSILREPLLGRSAVCPVPPDTKVWIASPRAVVASLVHAHELSSQKWGNNRILNLPGVTTTISEMLEALERAGGDPKLVRFERDPFIESIVCSWPVAIQTRRASELGFPSDVGIDDILRAYIEDYLRK